MSTPYSIPLTAQPQTFTINLAGVVYTFTLLWRKTVGWVLDIADSQGNPLLYGMPLVTGCDLLAQFKYLGIGGQLIAQTTSDPDAVPTFENLGTDGNLYFVTNP